MCGWGVESQLEGKSGFVSGHRLGDAAALLKSVVHSGIGLLVILVALMFSTQARAENGPEVYKERCAACHGKEGKGDTIFGKNLKIRPLDSPEVQAQSDSDLAAIISKGKNRMPPFDRKLSKDQIREVIEYVRSLKPQP